MTPVKEPTQPNLSGIAGKLDLIDQKLDSVVECVKDHEERIRVVEVRTVTMGVIFSVTSLAGIIALVKAVFGL